MEALKSYPSWLEKYYERGFRLIYYPTKKKNPEGKEASEWPNRIYTKEDYVPGQNIGIVLGNEIAPGQFLADIDFDWIPGIELSGGILPATKFVYGHPPSKPISHAFYTTHEPVISKAYENIDYKGEGFVPAKKTFVELRGVKYDGSYGNQSMVPPSIWTPKGEELTHPGEVLEFYKSSSINAEISFVDDLPRRTLLYAIACMLHAWIAKGSFKHDMRLAVAGFLLSNDLTKEEATSVMRSVIEYNGPHDKGDEVLAIESTLRAISNKKAFTGKSKLIELLGEHGHAIVKQIMKWLGGSEFVEYKGKVLPNQENIRRSIELRNINLSFNEFSCKPLIEYPEIYKGELEDNIELHIWLETERKHRFLPPKTLYQDVVRNVAWENRFHPVIDYLKELVWDGIPRINTWVIQTAGADDTPYIQSVSSIMLMAAVKRITDPGCKYDEMVVFESGKQGLLKSSALRTLCPKDEWFSDNLPLNLKAQEIMELTMGKWIIEVAELNKIRSTQMDHVKSMLSRQDDTARLAYAHNPKTQRRQCIFVGTTNSYTYLTDATGNRRFWPIRVNKFDIVWIRENRDQLWAEAFMRAEKGDSIRLPEELYKPAEDEQENRLVDDDWKDKLDRLYDRQYQRISNESILIELGIPIDRRTQAVSTRIAEIMQSLGFTRASQVRDKETGKQARGWKREVVYPVKTWVEKRRLLDENDTNIEMEKEEERMMKEEEELLDREMSLKNFTK